MLAACRHLHAMRLSIDVYVYYRVNSCLRLNVERYLFEKLTLWTTQPCSIPLLVYVL